MCTVALRDGGVARAQALDPIRYTLRFPAPHTHYVEVEAAIPTAGRAEVEVYMATWTPGSYLIREYERNVEAVTASAGTRALAVEKSTKNRWKITTGGAPSVTLRYKVYSREMTVRNNWVEAGFAMLNGAPTFITLVERAARPHEVRVELPAAWKRRARRALDAGRRVAEHLSRRRLRHARRQPDHHRQPASSASSPSTARSTSLVFEGDTVAVRCRPRRRRRAEDRRCRRGT